MLNSAHFTLELIGDQPFAGYTDGSTWNGWACPLFTCEEGLKIADILKNHQIAYYDDEKDAFFFGEDDDELECFAAVQFENGPNLYPIGAYSWIWEQSPALEVNSE